MASSTPSLPRAYQSEVLEEARRRDVVVRIDDGTGKSVPASSSIEGYVLRVS